MRQDISANAPVLEQRAGRSRLLSRLYRDVGVAAVAAEFDLPAGAFETEIAEAVERGAAVLLAPRRDVPAA